MRWLLTAVSWAVGGRRGEQGQSQPAVTLCLSQRHQERVPWLDPLLLACLAALPMILLCLISLKLLRLLQGFKLPPTLPKTNQVTHKSVDDHFRICLQRLSSSEGTLLCLRFYFSIIYRNKSTWAENIHPEDTHVNFKDGVTQTIPFWALPLNSSDISL